MALDIQTLFAVTVFAAATAGCLLLFSWFYHRNIRALGFWGVGFLLGSFATALITARGVIPDLWSIQAGNAILALAYGVMWSGVRDFEGRRIVVPVACVGAAIWLLACQIDAFYAVPRARVALMAAIVASYTLLNVLELWRSRSDYLMSRWPIMVLLIAHAAIFMIRIPLAGALAFPVGEQSFHVNWFTLLIFETIFHSFCVAYLLGSMARERIVMVYRRDSLVDPLTGIPNRRAFLETGQKILHRAKIDRRSAALLMFDLDRFKQVNDRFGHGAGDRVLKGFCAVVSATMRPTDLFGRLGGEEFGCLMPHCRMQDAVHAAERVRSAFEKTRVDIGGRELSATVSVGVAVSRNDQDLATLILIADEALYRAKANGRNRVEPAAGPFVRMEQVAAG